MEMKLLKKNKDFTEEHSGRATKGSQFYLQNLINKYPDLINKELGEKITVDWVSPLESDDYREYKDEDFLEKLGIREQCDSLRKLKTFWPKNGAHWDALGKADKTVFIVEAKGHIEEIVSPKSCATSLKSIKLIKKSLQETKDYLNIKSDYDWSKTFYQYANRLAHLYYLRECCKIDAHLVFIYFTEDKTWDDYGTEYGWKCAEIVVNKILGIPKNHKLSKFIHNIYIDVNQIH